MQNTFTKIKFIHQPDPHIISVLIPVKNDVTGLDRTLESIRRAVRPRGVKVEVLVGNDGNDQLIDDACRRHHTISVSTTSEVGSYAIRNLLVGRSRGSTIAFTDAGVAVDRNWLVSGQTAINLCSYVGGKIQLAAASSDSAVQQFQYVNSFRAGNYLSTLRFAPTANLWVTRDLIERIGGFDSRLISSGDYEFGDRVHRAGLRQYYAQQCVVVHELRNQHELVQKQKRVAYGHVQLQQYYPERFGRIGAGLLRSIVLTLLPPLWVFSRPKLYSLNILSRLAVVAVAWHINYIYHSTCVSCYCYYLLRKQ